MHLSFMCGVVTKQQHQITILKSAMAKLSVNYTGTLIWKISDYTLKMSEAKAKEGMELISPPFYTSQYGYKLQVNFPLIYTWYNAVYFQILIIMINCLCFLGIDFLEWKRNRGQKSHFNLYKNFAR